MAGGMDLGTGGGKKRTLDAALNLVPFIDLMAVTIVFLIMSAVWTQLGRLEVRQTGAHRDDPVVEQPAVTLVISDARLVLSLDGKTFAEFPLTRDERGRIAVEALDAKLAELKGVVPDQPAITVRADDALLYDDLVRVIDACVARAFPAVSLQPA